MTIHHDSDVQWLVLLYQFPKGPDSRRVKTWRRLQNIGAVAIKNSVYVLPANEQAQEDFQWLLTELRSGGGDGVILESRVVDGMTNDSIRQLFNTARGDDYRSLHQSIKGALDAIPSGSLAANEEAFVAAKAALNRSKKRFSEIEAIDFFAAKGHELVENEIRTLTQRIADIDDSSQREDATMPANILDDLTGLTWVTRRGVKVDRVASAWLVKRWIDPDAKFKFVDEKNYTPTTGEIRFDMFEAEITHEGDHCTFEVLAKKVREHDIALQNVGEIVHDIDLKDSKFERVETSGIASLLTGIFSGLAGDDDRIQRAGSVFDDLYRFYETTQA